MDVIIRTACPADLSFLSEHDRHIPLPELDSIIHLQRVLIMDVDGKPVGWLRWGMFWDNTPFMNLLYLLDSHRLQGHGRALVAHWEQAMRSAGHTAVMTSTQANEGAQHFYRRLGYRDIGGFLLPDEAYELIMMKEL
ncbi:MAG: GNAT family N-acetyltransferase [Clostridia bacterium]|nr:GNAT family N-acetyltransferase [Clostridia bacterium]